MWNNSFISDRAYAKLEELSEDTFTKLFNLAGNRPDLKLISGVQGWNNPEPVQKSNIRSNYEEIVFDLNKQYDRIDDLVTSIRSAVHIILSEKNEFNNVILTTPKSILDIEKGVHNDTVFFYGLISVLGRRIANSINFKMQENKSFLPTNLDKSIDYIWGNLLLQSYEEKMPQEKFQNSVIKEGLKLTADGKGYEVRSSIPAKIANLTNIPNLQLKTYDGIATTLSDSGHYKSLFKTVDIMRAKKVLF